MRIVRHDIVQIIEQAFGAKRKSNCQQVGVRPLAAAPFLVNDEVLDLQEAVQAEIPVSHLLGSTSNSGRNGVRLIPLPPVHDLGRRERLGEQRVEQAAAGGGGGGEARLQPVAQRHQRIDLGDDAVLFGEGWEGNGNAKSRRFRCSSTIRSRLPSNDWR